MATSSSHMGWKQLHSQGGVPESEGGRQIQIECTDRSTTPVVEEISGGAHLSRESSTEHFPRNARCQDAGQRRLEGQLRGPLRPSGSHTRHDRHSEANSVPNCRIWDVQRRVQERAEMPVYDPSNRTSPLRYSQFEECSIRTASSG